VAVVRHFAGEYRRRTDFYHHSDHHPRLYQCDHSDAAPVYNAMARDRLFFRRAAEIHPKYHTPNPALWMQGVWACLLVLSGSFDQLTDMLIFAAFFFYGATAFGVFIMRRREPNAERPYKVWGYPVVPALFIIFCAELIVITCFSHPREAMLGVLLMLTGVPFYFWWTRKSA
jgi:APA family basic amino acid/polyamine antiporter